MNFSLIIRQIIEVLLVVLLDLLTARDLAVLVVGVAHAAKPVLKPVFTLTVHVYFIFSP